MASTELYKKALSLVIFIALLGAILGLIATFGDDLRSAIVQSSGQQGEPNPSMSGSVFDTVVKVLRIVLWMAIVIAIVRFIAFMAIRAAARRSAQAEVSSLLKTVFSIIVYIIAFVVIFQTQFPDVPLTGIFTGSTILGIVVGLALQDTLGNLFAGIAMQADQPFQVGDVVSLQSRGIGVIEGVSWRGVRIRTFQNKLLVISNAVLGKELIEVAPKDNLNARIVFFNTVYSASPAHTASIVREAMRHCDNVSQKMRPVVRIRNLGDNGIDWEVKFWVEDYTKFNDTDALVRERIWYAFQREKIHFAYPTRSVHVEEPKPEIDVEVAVNVVTERLKRVPIFDPLSQEEMDRLAKSSKSRIYAPGEAIVRLGGEGNSMFIINSGRVEVQIIENGHPKKVNELSENDFFGEMSLLTGQPRTANVIATVETEVLQIRKNALKPILENNPVLVQSITDIITERLAMLTKSDDEKPENADQRKKGVLRSIRKFFGIRSQ